MKRNTITKLGIGVAAGAAAITAAIIALPAHAGTGTGNWANGVALVGNAKCGVQPGGGADITWKLANRTDEDIATAATDAAFPGKTVTAGSTLASVPTQHVTANGTYALTVRGAVAGDSITANVRVNCRAKVTASFVDKCNRTVQVTLRNGGNASADAVVAGVTVPVPAGATVVGTVKSTKRFAVLVGTTAVAMHKWAKPSLCTPQVKAISTCDGNRYTLSVPNSLTSAVRFTIKVGSLTSRKTVKVGGSYTFTAKEKVTISANGMDTKTVPAWRPLKSCK